MNSSCKDKGGHEPASGELELSLRASCVVTLSEKRHEEVVSWCGGEQGWNRSGLVLPCAAPVSLHAAKCPLPRGQVQARSGLSQTIKSLPDYSPAATLATPSTSLFLFLLFSFLLLLLKLHLHIVVVEHDFRELILSFYYMGPRESNSVLQVWQFGSE